MGDDVISRVEETPDVHRQSIQYMDCLARQLALKGKFDECAILHAASNLLDRLSPNLEGEK